MGLVGTDMIRTNNYLIVKKCGNKWVPIRENIFRDWRGINNKLIEIQNGEWLGHSKKGEYNIMQVCYCDFDKE